MSLDDTLPASKVDNQSLPGGADPRRFLRASDYNALRSAIVAPNEALVTATGSTTARSLAARASDSVNALDYTGIDPTGAADSSAAVQAMIDLNKGKRIVFPRGTYLVAGLLLDGATYNGTEIVVEGELKLKASGGATNFGGAWVGLVVKDASRITLDLRWDGNRANQTDNEHHYCVGIAGASQVNIPRLEFREIRGDGLYISQSSWTAESTVPTDIAIGTVRAYNSADDGRNAVSIISGRRISIGQIHSHQVGGVVNSIRQPGGLDIEPNYGYQTVDDVTVGTVDVTTAGTAGLQIYGKAIGASADRNWCVQHVAIGRAIIARTSTDQSSPWIYAVRDLSIDAEWYFTGGQRGRGPFVDFVDRIFGSLRARTVTIGMLIAQSNEIRDSDLALYVTDFSDKGIRVSGARRCRFRGRVNGATNSSSTFAVYTLGNQALRAGVPAVQSDVVWAVDAPYDAQMARAFHDEPTDPVTFERTRIRDCDWSGYASPASTHSSGAIPKINVQGLSWATAAPANGLWVAGDIVWNTAPAAGGAPGWVVTVGGSPGTSKAMANLAP